MQQVPSDFRKKIQDFSYGLRDIIGKGFSSVVYRGLNDKTRQTVAIKVIDLKSIQNKPQKRMLEGQIDALNKLAHGNILKCHGIIHTVNNCYIITQFCNEGDLQNLLHKRGKLPEEEAVPIIREIILGFLHIAEAGYLHRDMKPANILLKDRTVKLADFGFAKRASTNPKESINVGSPLYMSPQALQSNIYTIKNDIWSIGVIIYEILHGKAPWTCTSQKQLNQQIVKGNVAIIKTLSEDLKDLIRRCLTVDPTRRLSAKQLATHPFVKQMFEQDFPQLLRKPTSVNQNDPSPTPQLKQPRATAEELTPITPKLLHHPQPHPRTHGTSHQPDKQLNCQYNWLRFLQHFATLFPKVSDSGRYTLGLHFIVVKQLLAQFNALKLCLTCENALNIEGWSGYMGTADRQKLLAKVSQHEFKTKTHKQQLGEWVPIVGKDRRLASIANQSLQLSEFLSMLAISYAIQECRMIWKQLQKQSAVLSQTDFNERCAEEMLRLDYTITYYQLNCLLAEEFADAEYFGRMAKLETIVDNRPIGLGIAQIGDLGRKINALEICK